MTNNKKEKYVIGIRSIGIIMFVLGLLITFLLQFSIHEVKVAYEQTINETKTYIEGQNILVNIKNSSDTMSEKIRSYVATGNISYAYDYFLNYEDEKTRSNSLESISNKIQEKEIHDIINNILSNRDLMVKTEKDAMILALDAYNVEKEDYPAALDYEKSDINSELYSDEERLKFANDLLYSSQYQKAKRAVNDDVSYCLDKFSTINTEMEIKNLNKLEYYQNRQRLVVTASLVLVVIIVATFSWLVVKPLSKNSHNIAKGEYLEENGLKDLRILAVAYNKMLDRIKKDNEKLSYDASHDGLTGLLNRFAYATNLSKYYDIKFSLLLLDVDNFKSINDTLGHDVGDLVLKKISNVLKSHFRSDDEIYRLGGDEIAIVLKNIDNTHKNIIEEKYEQIKNDLLIHDEKTPEVNISVGVTFAKENADTEKIYKEADIALYKAKERKNTIVFYEDVI